jgi:hypothetical protein
MALVSPGVQVTVIDESNYAPAAVGSVAYVLLATAENKAAPGGSSIAAGTLAENAGRVYTITSQRDLSTTFGYPIFKTTVGGAAINGDEQNEYGLLAAYSALGISNRIYVQRADVDLGALEGTTIRPLDNPSNGNLWLDTTSSRWGIFEWNFGTQNWVLKNPIVITSETNLAGDSFTPNVNFGSIGDYAVNALDAYNPVFYKIYDNSWRHVGTPEWQIGIPAVTGTAVNPVIGGGGGTISINGTSIILSDGADVVTVRDTINSAAISGILARVVNNQLIISANSAATSNVANIQNVSGTPLTSLGITPGAYPAAATSIAPYFSVPTWQGNAFVGRPTGSVWQKASAQGTGMNMVVKEFNSTSVTWNSLAVNSYANVFAATFSLDPTGGGVNINQGVVFNQYDPYENSKLANYMWQRKTTGATIITGSTSSPSAANIGATFTITTRANLTLSALTTYTVTISTATVNGFIQAIAGADIPYVSASLSQTGNITLTHSQGGDLLLIDGAGTPLANVGINDSATNVYQTPIVGDTALYGSNWEPLEEVTYTPKASQPYVAPTNGTLWYYNTPSRVDIMISNGSAWVGYRTLTSDIRGYDLSQTNPNGVIMATEEPTQQDNGNSLVYGDLWLDTGELEDYPKLYRYQSVNGIDQWVLIDNTDTVGQNGMVFADVRWASDGTTDPAIDTLPSISSMLTSNYVDLDAPDPTLYPRGMLAWNTRASGYNVKEFRVNYFNAASYPNESLPVQRNAWVSVSGFDVTGVPNFGRKAPRGVVVAALKAAIDSSTDIREDATQFNIMSCPGYPELIPNMVNLNEDRDNTAFIIGDTPLRLVASGTDIQAWATNSLDVTSTGEYGLNTINPYIGIYYPHGQTNDLSGNAVVVPASHAVLRALLKSDNISYPWFAPAGTRRGLIDNLNAIGYIQPSSGQFISIGVTQGLRDTLYENKINPLTFLPSNGLLIYGQKTLSAVPSALDRINVARLVNYVRRQLNVLSQPFVFEPNDPITRNAMLSVVNSLLNDLVVKRGITDYLAVCDTTNNTPERVARNELWVDVAIQPTKDVEFIYIPIRLKNPGEIQGGNLASAATLGTGA